MYVNCVVFSLENQPQFLQPDGLMRDINEKHYLVP